MQPHDSTNPRSRSVVVACAFCGADVTRKQCIVLRQPRHFCSRACLGKWNSEHRAGPNHPRYAKIIVRCVQCGKGIERTPYHAQYAEHAFCDTSCYAQWRSTNLHGTIHPHYRKTTVACAICGKAVSVKPSQATKQKRRFCDNVCRGRWMSQNIHSSAHPKWKGGSIDYRGPNWKRQSQAARKRDGCCQLCHTSDNLTAHHIKPFREFGYIRGQNDLYKQANAMHNLITLCQSCHGRVEHGSLALPSS
jgi:ribosomal protein L31